MVFIAMDQDDALNRTAQYQIQYAPSASRDRVTFNTDPRSRFNREPQQTISVVHNRDGTSTSRTGRSYIYSSSNENEIRMPQMPHEFMVSQPDFNIATEFSDEEDGANANSEPPGPVAIIPVSILRRTPNRIGTLPFENEENDESDSDIDDEPTQFGSEDALAQQNRRRAAATGRHPAANTSTTNLLNVNFDLTSGLSGTAGTGSNHAIMTNPHAAPSLTEAWDAHASATQDAIRAVGGGTLLAPHARFHIEKKKSKCTIRFDPPVSGRFILLKMWSSHHDPGSNIDIQSVLAKGYAGPRYFPAVDML